jgi:integrase
MKLPSHLWVSRHGIFYIRITYKGVDIKRSLYTRDPAIAQAIAYKFGAGMGYQEDLLKNLLSGNREFSTYIVEKRADGSVRIETDGTEAEHQRAMQAADKAHLLNNNSAPPPTAPVLAMLNCSLGESINDYWKEKSEDFVINTVKTYQSSFNKLMAGLGANTNLSSIDSTTFVNWRITQDKTLSPDSVTRDCGAYKSLFDWAIKRSRYVGVNPIEDAKLSKKVRHSRISAHERPQSPFTKNDLDKIFDAARYDNVNKPCAFWMPIIALYSGARLNEIASIKHADISKYSPGKYAFKIRDGKTLASKRIVPIHLDIVNLGFIEYLEDVKSNWPDAELIFPYLKAASKNGFGNLPGRDFSALKTNLELGDDKVFHSFRKTLISCLQFNGCAEEHRKLYVGHSEGDTKEDVHSQVYSTGKFNPEAIEQLVFKHLRYNDYLKFNLTIKPYIRNRFGNYLLKMKRKSLATIKLQPKITLNR